MTEEIEEEEVVVWDRVLVDLGDDCLDFGRDFVSTTARVVVCYEVLSAVHVGRDLALTTAFVVVSAPIFTNGTNWWHRTRRHHLLRRVLVPRARRSLTGPKLGRSWSALRRSRSFVWRIASGRVGSAAAALAAAYFLFR